MIESSSTVFALTMLVSWKVKSSSDWMSPSITVGRTCGGGTGSTVTSIHSGRAHFGSKPIFTTSSSVMRRNTSNTFCALSTCLRWPVPGMVSMSSG